jgi:hypothetical protein
MVLDPGGCTVVVGDLAAFRGHYGMSANVAGQYGGHLGNRGEGLVLKLGPPLEAAILRFRYADTRRPTPDGGGESPEIKDPTAAAVTWNDPETWRAADPTPGGP